MDYRYRMNRMDCRPAGTMHPRQTEAAPPTCTRHDENDIYHYADKLPLTMGYVPMQTFGNTYELCRGLQFGTIFPELCKPFKGVRGNRC